MHKNATKCNKTQRKWCENKHGASKIIDTFETYQSLCVRRFETPQCINSCRMIWWSTYGGFEATPTSFHLICLKTCQIICLFCWTVMFICKNKPNIGKICQIRRTVNLFVKLRQKHRSPGICLERRLEVQRSPRQSFVQSGAIYRRIWPWGALICLKHIYNFWCSMLVYAPFALCFVTLHGIFMHFPELTY
jgi:hypothetical protein